MNINDFLKKDATHYLLRFGVAGKNRVHGDSLKCIVIKTTSSTGRRDRSKIVSFEEDGTKKCLYVNSERLSKIKREK